MAKIVEINGEIISIGLDNGSIKEVRLKDLNFNPAINEEVDVFESESKCIISKKEKITEKEGININVSNNNGANPTYIANNTKAVNKVVYCILAFCFGGLGIHKFFAGKVSTGILYILFIWTFIPSFIALIDLISALCKKADANGNILV